MVEGFANQGIALRIAPGGVLWAPRQEVNEGLEIANCRALRQRGCAALVSREEHTDSKALSVATDSAPAGAY